MSKDLKIRNLRPDEIECRISTISESGVSLLLYKDARVDMSVLDEVFGIYGWMKQYRMIGDSLFCQVSIRDENGSWISKEDVGTASFAEPVKGMASDAFKRACFNIGIGRELYSAPFIWLPAERVNIQKKNDKFVVKDSFKVSDIAYDEATRSIIGLKITNQKKEIVYTFNTITKKPETRPEQKKISAVQVRKIHKEMSRTGVSEKAICERYKVSSITDMNRELYDRALEALEKTKDAA